jgi:hypothetical protein
MKSIQQLFSLKKAEEPKVDLFENQEEDREQIRITYYQSGWAASVKATGKPIVLRACLQNLFSSFEDQCRKQKLEQERLKQPYKEEQEKERTELKKCEIAIGVYEKKEQDIESLIQEKNQHIVDVKHNPGKYIDEGKGMKAQFYVGLFMILPITLYLLVFYISASYSAFFKDFSDDSLSAAIFDANSFTNSFKASWLEGLLVVTIPFVFMGLGYVIHMTQKNKKGFKNGLRIAALYLLTFSFDALLAYQIEKKIYDFNKTLNSPPYNLRIALGEAEFWMIIFAGFVVYVIWGLVFDYVMKEYENMDKIRMFIRAKREELVILDKQKNENTERISNFKQQLATIVGKIALLQSKIDGFVFPIKEYLNYHNQYREGWYQAIETEIALPHKEKTQLLENCEEITTQHLKELNLGIDPDYQHLVYSKN